MQVTTIVRAQAAYACIKTEDVSLDVRLESGRSAPASLRQWAAEQVTTAERLQRNAGLALAAAMQLEHGGSSGSSGSRKPSLPLHGLRSHPAGHGSLVRWPRLCGLRSQLV